MREYEGKERGRIRETKGENEQEGVNTRICGKRRPREGIRRREKQWDR